jgi:hypothetical protein
MSKNIKQLQPTSAGNSNMHYSERMNLTYSMELLKHRSRDIKKTLITTYLGKKLLSKNHKAITFIKST